MPRLKAFGYPREVTAYAVWTYHRFALSTADVEDLLAERKRGCQPGSDPALVESLWPAIRRFHPARSSTAEWHFDQIVISICARKHWLWRAIDANGYVPYTLVQTRRNLKAAKRFFQRLITLFGAPRIAITDKFTDKLRNFLPPRPHRCICLWGDHTAEMRA